MTGGKSYAEQKFAVVPEDVLYAEISANAVRLWAILERHSGIDGRCYPGRKRMAELMRVSEDTITRVKAELVKAELLEATERFDQDGRRTSDDLILRGARRKFADTGRRKFADTNSNAVEPEPEERELPLPPHRPQQRDPTDTRPIQTSRQVPVWVPEPKATADDRARGLRHIREILGKEQQP